MNAWDPRPAHELRRRTTCYEVVADLPTGETLRLGFTARASFREFMKLAMVRRDLLIPHIVHGDASSYSTADGLRFGPVRVHKSGRTERECALLELPWEANAGQSAAAAAKAEREAAAGAWEAACAAWDRGHEAE